MSKKKKNTKGRKSLLSVYEDERTPKIIGVFFLFLSLYLIIAFVSYFFTWKYDQDKLLIHGWSILFESDLLVKNKLGRFGAVTANSFIYWGFGICSFGLTLITTRLGLDLIRRKPLGGLLKFSMHVLFVMTICSIILEFCFHSSEFPWGGVMGYSIFSWMTNFVGQLGLLLFLMLILLSLAVWLMNPEWNPAFDRLSSQVGAISLPTFAFFNSTLQENDGESSKKGYFESLSMSKTNSKKGKNSKENGHEGMHVLDLEDTVGDEEMPIETTVSLDIPNIPKQKKTATKDPEDIEMDVVVNEPTEEIKAFPNLNLEMDPVKKMNEEDKKLIVEEEDLKHLPPYDPTQDLSNYAGPTIDLLKDYSDQKVSLDRAELEANKNQIVETLSNYKIKITGIRATIGPTVTLYEIIPEKGTKIKSIKNLEGDIALSLAALGIRIIAPIPGKGTIGIEVPNKKKNIVSLREVLNTEKFQNAKMQLPLALGKTISNEVFVADLAKMPHLLIAGATGQGKSVGINTILMSLLYKQHPSKVKIVMIDPKKVELFPYSKLEKHFLTFLPDQEEPIITDITKAIHTLVSLTKEMDNRYDLLKQARVRNIKEYNQKFIDRKLNPNNGHKYMPYIVLVIDEFADLIMTAGKEIEMPIARLAQLSRAIGIHLIIATQRPTTNIITGMIKANFPARLAYKVTSLVDSRTILDAKGAEQLIGMGDMLFTIGSDIVRLQCAFVDTPEVERVIDYIEDQQGYPEPYFLPEVHEEGDIGNGAASLKWSDLDPLFEEAARLVVSNQHGSTSMIQRKMQLGYNRAGRIMDQMHTLGIVGDTNGSKPREVLFQSEVELLAYFAHLKQQ